jgi:uncharacterized protein with beta-barrel porin domain
LTFNPGDLCKSAAPANLASWRATLATGVASAALFAYGGRPVRAAPPVGCAADISGTIVTCSGDQSPGISLLNGGGSYGTLHVNALTSNIVPAAGTYGINFTSNGPVELNLDAGAFNIVTTGNNAAGVRAASNAPGGGSVTINSSANISTSGDFANGIVAGSPYGFTTQITASGVITTTGNNSSAIYASTQYGEARITSSATIGTGGSSSSGIVANSMYGNVTIVSTGDIETVGAQSSGISSATNSGDIHITSLGAIATSGTAAHGISANSNSGDIDINSRGIITTQGDNATGIYASGGSGDVKIASTGDIETAGDFGLGIYVRAAQTTKVYSYGNIVTRGDDAPAIAAAGANGVAVVSKGTIRTYGTDSPGITAYANLDVGVVSTSKIATTGAGSDGINVLSLTGMAVVVSSGDISATGTGSAGIYAAGYAGTIVMNRGNVVGGPCCAGIMQTSAGANQLLNWGTITAGLSDYAIDAIGDSTAVVNFGTVTGDVRLFDTGGSSSFTNQAGALFNMGVTVSAGHVVNDGTLAPGGRGIVQTTALGDDLTQNAGGTLAIDINGATADRINVSDGAVLAGRVAVTVAGSPTTAAQSFTIIQASSGVTNNGLGLIASPALHATLSFPTATTVVLGVAIDFVIDGLDRNQRSIAANANGIVGGGGSHPVLTGLLSINGVAAYQTALDQLSPVIYPDAEVAALYASRAFSTSLLSCKVNGTDSTAIIREGQCFWGGANARFLDSDTTSTQSGFNETAGLFTAGAQFALDDVWRLGIGVGYQSSTLTTSTGAESEGELAQAGIALKYNSGPLLLAGTVGGGGSWNETRRPMAFAGFSGVAEGDYDLGIISGGFRAAYVFGAPSLFFKPILDANITHLTFDDFRESGGNGAALNVRGGDQTVFSLAPIVEAGTEWWLSNGTLVRPLIRFGAVWSDNADFDMTASFVGVPSSVAPFTTTTESDRTMGLIGIGLDMINGDDAALRLSYDAEIGDTTQIHSFGIKGSAKF